MDTLNAPQIQSHGIYNNMQTRAFVRLRSIDIAQPFRVDCHLIQLISCSSPSATYINLEGKHGQPTGIRWNGRVSLQQGTCRHALSFCNASDEMREKLSRFAAG